MIIGVDATCWGNKRGFGRFTRELLSSILNIDDTNEYVFFVDSQTAGTDEIPTKAKKIVVETTESPIEAASSSGRRSVRDILAMSRHVSKHDLDLFFFPAVYSYFPIFNRTKVIVTIHDMIADKNPSLVFPNRRSKIFWKLKQNAAVRQSDLILTVSEYSKVQIGEYFKMPASRLRVINEGAREVFRIIPEKGSIKIILDQFGIDSEKRMILYVGGISPHKNLSTLLEAYGSMRDDPELSNVTLVLVGDYVDDPFLSAYPALKDQVSELGLEEHVVFTGFVADEELACLYNAAALLVFPSVEEGFGLPALEAMACGTPVASSDRSSLPEVIGDAGVFFDPHDAKQIAEVIAKVLKDETVLGKMKVKSLERSREFSWEKAAADTIAIFEETAAR